MGNNIACSEPKRKAKTLQPPKSEIITSQRPTNTPKSSKQQQQSNTPQNNYNCQLHPDEILKAVCLTDGCPHSNKVLCCECLIDNPCQKKVRIGEFLRHLRNSISKDAQDLFMEMFDEKNQVKTDLNRQIVVVGELLINKLQSIATKNIQSMITHYYWGALKLPIKLNVETVRSLQLITQNKAAEASAETLDFGIYLLQNRGVVEQLCEEIEHKKNTIQGFANDFAQKFQQLENKFIDALLFLFHLLITPMEFLIDDSDKPQQMSKRLMQSKEQQIQNQQNQQQQIQKQQQQQLISNKCLMHQGEVLAICIKSQCSHKDRKMCADCLIENKCEERMKINEFCSRIARLVSQDYIDQLCLPWDDIAIVKQIQKVFQECIDNIKTTLLQQQNEIVKDMFLKYHLIEEATPKEIRGELTKEYFEEFLIMMNLQKISSTNKSINLAIQFINHQTTLDQILGAIVKTEQILPKKADKLQHKLMGLAHIYIDKVQNLMDLYKTHTEFDTIQKQFNLMNTEPLSLEETIYKIKNDGKSLSNWEPYITFKASDKIIMDICFVNESIAAIGLVDGNILIYNVNTKKQVSILKHGNIVTALRAFQFNQQSVLVSSGYSSGGHSICTWDLKNKSPNFQVLTAHNDSIRKLKYLHVNPTFAQTFYSSNNNSTTAQLSSQVSQTGSQVSIFLDIDEQLLSCSDDGTIKLWKIDTNLRLVEDLILRQGGSQVFDFTLLNGCILVSAQADKTLSLSIPFQQSHPFQQVTDDSPVYAVSPIDQLQQKKKHNIQQKFITGNERGVAKIYQWQNGRAVIMKILNMHEDKITKISMLQPGFIASVSLDKSICLTLIQQAKVLTRLERHSAGIVGFAYLKMNGMLISADSSGYVIIWK